jgi:CDP-2,3-bis-(O-geranylgeranyl)-sn-glycerol synthase
MSAELLPGATLVAPLFFGVLAHGLCIRFGLARGLAVPIDRGATLRGRRLFGDNKTWRGIVCVALGTALGFVLIRPAAVAPGVRSRLGLAVLGLAVGAAAMLAELPNSLLKRQLGIAPGRQGGGVAGIVFHVLDQVDVVCGAWLVLWAVAPPTVGRVLGSLACIYAGHQAVTRAGYRLGMRATAR